jgi:glutamate-1-semialdehyde 2,1-aminomutase
VEEAFARHPNHIAAVIVEPVAANMGVVSPSLRFLEDLRELTRMHGTLLIFDEVITGFRLAYGGAQTVFKIEPDLTTLGKIIGGGLPVGAYGGRREIMQRVAPLGPVYQAGTLSGNPLAMRAGLETLKLLSAPGFYDDLNRKAARLIEGLRSAVDDSGVAGQVSSVGSLLTLFFTKQPVRDYAGAQRSDTRRYAAFFGEMLDRNVFLPPSQFEALFVSAAHTEDDIDRTVAACREGLNSLLAATPAV